MLEKNKDKTTILLFVNKFRVQQFIVFKNILKILLYDIPYIILSYFSYSNLYLMLL